MFKIILGQIRVSLSLLAFGQCTLATNLTLSYHKKKLFQIHLRSTWMCQNSFFLILDFFHWLQLDLVKLAKLACDQLCQPALRQQICQPTLRMGEANCQHTMHVGQQIASIHCAYTVTSPQAGFRHPDQMELDQTVRGGENDALYGPGHAHVSQLLAQTVHAVAKTKLPVSNPSVKNAKYLFQPSSPLPIGTS